MQEILAGLRRCWDAQTRVVIAAIIHVDGSAYRREGARCLIYETGIVEGILSGGCVENDLAEHANDVFRTHTPKKISYDFRWDQDNIWGLGLGCNGAIDVWLQLFDPVEKRQEAAAILDSYQRRMCCDSAYRNACVVASSDPKLVPLGKQWILSKDEEEYFERLDKHAGNPRIQLAGIEVELFIEKIEPLPKLYIFGSGPDAALLAQKAKELEWCVIIVDHRDHVANSMHFPNADKIILIPRGDYASVSIAEDAFIVVMTHNLDLDRLAVQTLLPLPIPYLGVLGSKQRINRILESIKNSGISILDKWMSKLHAPVGLDIGATTPEEITVSIIAELIACKNGRSGGFFKQITVNCSKGTSDAES